MNKTRPITRQWYTSRHYPNNNINHETETVKSIGRVFSIGISGALTSSLMAGVLRDVRGMVASSLLAEISRRSRRGSSI